jgi:hypothetical protein
VAFSQRSVLGPVHLFQDGYIARQRAHGFGVWRPYPVNDHRRWTTSSYLIHQLTGVHAQRVNVLDSSGPAKNPA